MALRRIARQEMVRSGIYRPIRIGACETRRSCRARTASTILRSRLKEPPVTPATRPNIFFIVVDDCGYADLGCTGQTDYATPALDELASEGVRFTQAYANAPLCTNTRVALITGRYQYRLPIGLVEPLRWSDRDAPEMGIPPGHPTLPVLLRGAGYRTTLHRQIASRLSAALKSSEERV
jgi:hypothetical protein